MVSATGTPLETLTFSLRLIETESFQIRKMSSWYQTPAFPINSGPDYINAICVVDSTIPPKDVLIALHNVEMQLARTRERRWGPRTCDIDIIDFAREIHPDLGTYSLWRDLPLVEQKTRAPETLILPHPRAHERAFVLVPLREVVPDWVHPVSGETIDQLIAQLPPEDVQQIQAIKP